MNLPTGLTLLVRRGPYVFFMSFMRTFVPLYLMGAMASVVGKDSERAWCPGAGSSKLRSWRAQTCTPGLTVHCSGQGTPPLSQLEHSVHSSTGLVQNEYGW